MIPIPLVCRELKMEWYLKPDKLELDAKDSVLNEEAFKSWTKTFENFLADVIVPNVNRNTDTNKLGLLTNHVSPVLFEHIEAATYGGAMQILNELFVKKKNVVCARYMLLNRKQDKL